MPIPRLIHPVIIRIQPLDTGETIYDTNAREEIQVVGRGADVLINAQLEYRDSVTHALGNASYDQKGLKENEDGYILLRVADYIAKSYTPAIGDRVKSIAVGTINEQTVTTYLHRLKPVGHYSIYGATLLKCYFSDRKPSHNA